MKWIKLTLLMVFFATVAVAVAQSPEPPLSDARLSVNTLVREDIFAGFIGDDMERFSRGEKNIRLLIEKRPAAKAVLLAWQGGATLYRVRADGRTILAREAHAGERSPRGPGDPVGLAWNDSDTVTLEA